MNIDHLKKIESIATKFEQATGLSTDEARTITYWAIATHAIDILHLFPLVVLIGPPGTGKSTVLKGFYQLCPDAELVSGKATDASFRDIASEYDTVLIEEAEDITESLVAARYSRDTAMIPVKRPRGRGGWKDTKSDIFGATALHKKWPFKDPATTSRAIEIQTNSSKGPFTKISGLFEGDAADLKEIAEKIDWRLIDDYSEGRIQSTWAPLLVSATSVGDSEFIVYADRKIQLAQIELGAGQDLEPQHLAYLALLSLALDESGKIADRIPLIEVTHRVQSEGLDATSWTVGPLLRGAGFTTNRKGGEAYVYTGGAENLREIGVKLGVQDEWLEDEKAA